MGYKIGKLVLKSRVLLAPMLEPNDVAFRLLCKKAGCGLTYTGMVSPLSKEKMVLDDKPGLQLFGNSVRGIKSFIEKYDSEVGLWDFNLGCPSKLSRRLEHGAFMHGDLAMIEKILKVMRGATKKPVTVKLRKSENAIEIAKLAERIGVDAIGIHARTFGQGYSGDVDYDFALKLKKSVGIPVIYSGDVGASRGNRKQVIGNRDRTTKEILKDFDFVMIGRNAIGKPRVFQGMTRGNRKQIIDNRLEFREYLKLAKKYGLFFRQVKFQAMNFTKGMLGARRLREKLVLARSVSDVEGIMGKNK